MSTSLLPTIQTELNRYGLSIIFAFGIIGNCWFIILFGRHQQKSCSMYLLWSSVINNIYLILAIPPTLYSLDYGDLNSRSLIYCKLRFYLTNTLGQTARYYIILACIDRYIITVNNVRFRFFTKPSTARYFMLFIFLFWHIATIHTPVLTTIMNGRCSQFGLYYIIYYVYLTLFVGLIPLILLSIFGYLTYYNMRQLHLRIQPFENNRQLAIQRRDRDLLIMVLFEVAVYIFTMLLYPFILLEIAVTTYMGIVKSTDRIRIENFIQTIASLLVFINIGSRFYIYFIISKPFRHDFQRFFKVLWNRVIKRNEPTTNERVLAT